MNQHYPDLIDKLGEPMWWDERGVPRYLPFRPGLLNDIYAREAVLLKISCQGCGREFIVADSYSAVDIVLDKARTLTERVKDKSIHWGDPPNINCCGAGPTMNCEDLDVLEFWRRHHNEYLGDDGIVMDNEKYFRWKRIPELEIHLIDKPEYQLP